MAKEKTYIEGIVEGIQKSVQSMHDEFGLTKTEIFNKMDSVKEEILKKPCDLHEQRMDIIAEKVQENNDRSHEAEATAEDIKIKTRPIIEKHAAAVKAEVKEEERKWYQRTETKIGVTVGLIVGILNYIPSIITFIKDIFKGS